MLRRLWIPVVLAGLAAPPAAGQWQPVAGQMMTRFAKSVSPETVWPEYPRPQMVRRQWRYTTEKPAEGWEKPDFDDSAWKQGEAPFGAGKAFIGPWKTAWTTPDIWVRRTFDLEKAPAGNVALRLFHDEDAEVFINGKQVAAVEGYTQEYVRVPIQKPAQVLKAGENVLAIHCRQTRGGQGIDAVLVGVEEVEE